MRTLDDQRYKYCRFPENSKVIFHISCFYLFHVDNATNTVTLLHLIEGAVDSTQRLAVGDELVHLELAVQVVVDQTRELCATLDTTEGTSLPDTTGNKLECCRELANDHTQLEGKTYVGWRSPVQQRPHQ